MIRAIFCVCIVCLSCVASGADGADEAVCVLDGPDAQPMKDGLKRVGRTFSIVNDLNAESLSKRRVLVLCGANPPVDEAGKAAVESFLNAGGSVLGVGGGATCLIGHKLFDAEGYFLTGTTVHMTVFLGYHRLTFGYPGAKPFDKWTAGVPNLLRATQGPLMILGPKPTSILGYDGGGLYSAAAFQRVGKGLLLLIGPDPQGGNAYYTLDKPTLEPGDKLQTDLLLANAMAFLLDPHANLIPNGGFEENTDLPPEQSNWQVVLQNGASREWRRDGAPEGNVFLKIVCPEAKSTGLAQPNCPIVVERGRTYQFACRYRASVPWALEFSLSKGKPGALKQESGPRVSVPAAENWQSFTSDLAVPEDVSYVRPTAALRAQGDLSLDDITMHLAP